MHDAVQRACGEKTIGGWKTINSESVVRQKTSRTDENKPNPQLRDFVWHRFLSHSPTVLMQCLFRGLHQANNIPIRIGKPGELALRDRDNGK